MLRMPLPYAFGLAMVLAFAVALFRIASRTSVRDIAGKVDQMTAAAPATCGAAIEVPESVE
jgi:hypothetical protein